MPHELPLYLEVDGYYHAAHMTRQWADVFGEGVVQGEAGQFATAALAPAAMGVNVDTGSAWVARDGAGWLDRGAWQVTSDSVLQVAIAPNAAGNPRADLIVLEVLDTKIGGGSNDWRLRVVQGAPAAAPVPPAVPANSIPLATITVPVGAATIVQGNVSEATKKWATIGGRVKRIAVGSSYWYEESAGMIKTDAGIRSASVESYGAIHSYGGPISQWEPGDTSPRLTVDIGQLGFGPGNAAQDTFFTRAAAGSLRSGGNLQAVASIQSMVGAAAQIDLHTSGRIYFSSAYDTWLERPAGGYLDASGQLRAGGMVTAQLAAAGQVRIGDNGGLPSILFGTGTDAMFWRSAASTLETAGSLKANTIYASNMFVVGGDAAIQRAGAGKPLVGSLAVTGGIELFYNGVPQANRISLGMAQGAIGCGISGGWGFSAAADVYAQTATIRGVGSFGGAGTFGGNLNVLGNLTIGSPADTTFTRVGANIVGMTGLILGGQGSVWTQVGIGNINLMRPGLPGTAGVVFGDVSDVIMYRNGVGVLELASSDGGMNIIDRFQMNLVGGASIIRAGSFAQWSDARLKIDVTTLTGALEKLRGIRPVRFAWKEGGRRDVGVLAHDVAAVFPEVVGRGGTPRMATVDYGRLVAPLIAAIHELEDRLVKLEHPHHGKEH